MSKAEKADKATEKKVVIAEWDQWAYHPTEGAKLFLTGDEIPEGWTDHPDNPET